MSRKDRLQLGAFVAITLAFIVVLVLYQHRGSQIQRVEGRVQTIEHGNPCVEKGPHSAQCQRSRNLFARTVTFAQACGIVQKANPGFKCMQTVSAREGNQQSSPATGSQSASGVGQSGGQQVGQGGGHSEPQNQSPGTNQGTSGGTGEGTPGPSGPGPIGPVTSPAPPPLEPVCQINLLGVKVCLPL